MGKKKRITSQGSPNALHLSPDNLKKQKTSHLQLPEIPTAHKPQNQPASESKKAAIALALETFKRIRKDKKKTKARKDKEKTKTRKDKEKTKTSISQQKQETATPVEPVKKNKRPSKNKTNREVVKEPPKEVFYLKGRDVNKLLDRLSRVIEAKARHEGKEYDNIWMKRLFSVGINDVTRTLERMPAATFEGRDNEENGHRKQFIRSKTEAHGQETHLQAVLAAIDCHPRVVVSHLAGLASSRGVPLFFVEDDGTCSMRLGQLLKLKTTIAIGVKVGGSTINSVIQDTLNSRLMASESKEIISD